MTVEIKMARKKSKKARNEKIMRGIVAAALFGIAGIVLLFVVLCHDLPDIDDVKPLETRPGITILARDGSVVARYGGQRGDNIRLEDLPKHVPLAVLAIEDRRFYQHPGIDLIGLARAMVANVQEMGWVQGGSTITQQLAKNLFLTPDKTLRRKVQEAVMALYIDAKFDKNDILEAYLNRVYFGAGAYGIDAAARGYFSKPAKDLTVWESAVLAGLLKAPSRYSPAANPKLAAERGKTVLAAMEDAGYITSKKADAEAKSVKIKAPPGGTFGSMNRYYTDWIVTQIDDYVAEAGSGGITVKTTLDPRLQAMAEAQTAAFFKTLKPADKISQAAMVTLSKDGAVLAMIGGTDYAQSQFNRATQAQRQPGSAFKPFVFMAALESGYRPFDRILDAPFDTGKYRPSNYEDKYYGEVTLTEALAYSLNTATIRLLNVAGIPKLMDVASRAGFTNKFPRTLSTGLGAGEVNLLELVNAYAVLGNGGYAVWPYAVTEIRDEKGSRLFRRADTRYARVFSGRDVADLDSMMVQVVAQGTGQAAQLSRGHVAGKTGTTQNYRDAWFVGYTDNLVTGIWMGNDDDTPMNRVSGGRYPARLWHDYMGSAINVPVPSFGGIGNDATPEPVQPEPPRASPSTFSDLINRVTGAIGNDDVKPDNRALYNP
jgi:penicillin-binding protein 1A